MCRPWIVILSFAALSGCGDGPQPPAHLRIVGGDAERGKLLIQRYECGSCHRIDGVRGADGVVGPPLTDYAQRTLLAGIVPNSPRTLVPWLVSPADIDPDTGMPDLGIDWPEARDIATYLYTLGAENARVWPSEGLPYGRTQEQPVARTGRNEPSPREAALIERAMQTLSGQAERP